MSRITLDIQVDNRAVSVSNITTDDLMALHPIISSVLLGEPNTVFEDRGMTNPSEDTVSTDELSVTEDEDLGYLEFEDDEEDEDYIGSLPPEVASNVLTQVSKELADKVDNDIKEDLGMKINNPVANITSPLPLTCKYITKREDKNYVHKEDAPMNTALSDQLSKYVTGKKELPQEKEVSKSKLVAVTCKGCQDQLIVRATDEDKIYCKKCTNVITPPSFTVPASLRCSECNWVTKIDKVDINITDLHCKCRKCNTKLVGYYNYERTRYETKKKNSKRK